MTSPAGLGALLDRLDPARLRSLLVEAVGVYSPSYQEEPVARVFAARMEQAGLAVERQPVAPGPDGSPRANLLVRLGPQPPAMLWVGHIDTIEAPHGFTPPRLEGDLLHGLGTADMKSGCAAMVEAAIALHQSGLPLAQGLCLALVVGEEEYGDGSLALIESVRAPLVVDSEPTDLRPCISHNGYQEFELRAQGNRAHAAVPEFGANAIHAMLTWILAIYDGLMGPDLADKVVANPREIQGGSTLFVVPAACRAMLDVHWRPEVDPAAVGGAIERARRAASADHPQCRLEAEATFTSSGYENSPRDPLLGPLWRALAATGLDPEPSVFRSHSDAAIFQRAGALAVVCGPGRLEMAHSPEEMVSLAQVERAARLYAALAWEALVRA
jgi:acetylornithine deacetylase